MRRIREGQRPNNLISAQELACWAYCPEQWRLQYALGLKPENQQAMKAGTRHHERKAVAEGIASRSIILGRLLAVLGAGCLLWLVWGRF